MLSLRTVSAASLVAAALAGSANAQVVRSGAGFGVNSIIDQLNVFRADLGTLNPNQPGSFLTGRREINWDGVPDGSSDPNAFPGDFFNGATPGRARGLLTTTPGSGFLVSADSDNPTGTPRDFASIDPSYAGEFGAFSQQRLFTAVGSNITDVTFFIPGSSQPATTRGFGSVFSDVELDDSTYLEFYDTNNELIFTAFAPPTIPSGVAGTSPDKFSFVGVSFADPIVSRVRIFSGTDALGAGVLDRPELPEFPVDLVVMDDFIYGEPVPTPAGGALLAVAGLIGLRRRR